DLRGYAPSLSTSRKVAEQSKACRLTLLRMKLHATDVSLRNHRRVRISVICLADRDFRVTRLTVERMDKVEERQVFHTIQQRVQPPLPNLIPADLRHHQIVAEAAHAPANQAQSRSPAELLRLFKQYLHANTHAQQRRAF